MARRSARTAIPAIVGTVLLWLVLLAPVALSLTRLVAGGDFRFDWLIPAELFPLALLGGGLLLWAALAARRGRGIIGWSLGLAAVSLAGGQVLAVVTGLASGQTQPGGPAWVAVLASIALYTAALVVLAVAGARLVREL